MAEDVVIILRDVGVEVRTADDLSFGTDVASSIVNSVLSADFVCLVLGADAKNPAIWYEAGIAAGSRRPVLLVVDANAADSLPFNPFSAPIIRYHRGSSKILRENLLAYTRQVQPIAAQLKINWEEALVSPSLAIAHQPEQTNTPTEKDVQAQLVEHFMREGIPTGSYVQVGPNRRVDALISFPTLGDEFNTIIIEVKRRRSNEKEHISQVFDYMSRAAARLAMLVYAEHSGQEKETHISGPLGVLVIAADDLLGWDYQRIMRELVRVRNQVVHSS